jgi:hypothetical protein
MATIGTFKKSGNEMQEEIFTLSIRPRRQPWAKRRHECMRLYC